MHLIGLIGAPASEAQRGHALTAYNAGFMGFVPAGSFVIAGLAAAAGTRWAQAWSVISS